MANTNNQIDTKVLCKDGSYGIDRSSVNGKYDNSKTCINNGGRAENQIPNAIPIGNAPVMKGTDVLTAEDKFYEKLGIKYHDTHMFGVYSRLKGRFYLSVALVIGYFAYKKFKK